MQKGCICLKSPDLYVQAQELNYKTVAINFVTYGFSKEKSKIHPKEKYNGTMKCKNSVSLYFYMSSMQTNKIFFIELNIELCAFNTYL